MWPKSCKNVCDAAAEDNWNQMSLGALASCLRGQEEIFVTLEDKWPPVPSEGTSILVFPNSKAQRLTPIREEQPDRGCNAMAQRQPIICLARIFSHS